MQLTYPALDADCLIKIQRGEGHELVEAGGTPLLYLLRGDLLPWEIARRSMFYGPEIKAIFESIGLKIESLQEYKEKYCSDLASTPSQVLN